MNNDRFKYRVWDNDLRRYVSLLVFFNHHGEVCLIETGCFYQHKTVIEQCTGVQDKNGKLIYEGDIVKYPWPYGENVVAWNPKTCRFVTHPIGRPELKASFCNDFDEFNAARPVIIGNIHQNGGDNGKTD